MSIFVDENTKVVVQGLTGGQGRFHGLRNRDYGTQVVAGVTPGKGGRTSRASPSSTPSAEAVAATGANASLRRRCRPRGRRAAILEAAAAGIAFIVCITEGIPAQDEALVYNRLRATSYPGTRLLGPNCPGIISPGQVQHRHHRRRHRPARRPGRHREPLRHPHLPGAARALPAGGRVRPPAWASAATRCPGTNFIDCLAAFEADPDTRAVMMIGEIGGSEEESAADFIADDMTKPVVAYIAGVTAPPGRKMGHAGAIISGSQGTAQAKMEALAAAGVTVAANPTEAGEKMVEIVRGLP